MMDLTKQYILMAEKAEEIQKAWKPIIGDVFMGSDDVMPGRSYAIYIGILENKETSIWLPRQDQLQEMIDWNNYGSYHTSLKVAMLEEFYKTVKISIEPEDISMEQLWLAFVMKEKYNKVWTGQDWKVSNA